MITNKLKVAICCVNSKYIHSSLAPWCLFAGMKEYADKAIEAKVIEGTINENIDAIADRLLAEKADVVSFSCYIWNITIVYTLVEKIKKSHPGIITVLGGPEVSYNAESVLANSNVDYVLSGEGERSYPQLMNAILYDNVKSSVIDGLCYNKGDKFIISPPAILEGDPVSPFCDEYFEQLNGRIAYIETSRGCPYSCAFCLSGRCGKARFFDLDRAKSDIIKIANSGTQTVKFVDRTFNANKKRAKDILLFILDNYNKTIPKGVCFHFEIAGDILDEETIEILSSAPTGLFQLEIGMQSFNEKTLAYINRKTNTQKLINNILKLTKNTNMHIHIDLIAGLPYEDLESFKNSFNIAYSLNADMLQLGFLKLLYGADMRDKKDIYPCNYNETPPYEVIDTPWITSEELLSLHNIEDALDRIYNSGRFKRTLNYTIKETSILPFDFFSGFSEYIKDKKIKQIPLDTYTEYLYEYIKTFDKIDSEILREQMVCDRLSTNGSGRLPKVLQISDKRLKRIKNLLERSKEYPLEKGVVRGVAILYSQQKIVYADYVKSNSLKEYNLNYIPLDFFLEQK